MKNNAEVVIETPKIEILRLNRGPLFLATLEKKYVPIGFTKDEVAITPYAAISCTA
jgi:hypothetical protein